MYELFLAQFGVLFLTLAGLVVRLNNAAPDGGLYLNSYSLLDVSQSRSFWNPSRLPFLGLSLANAASIVFLDTAIETSGNPLEACLCASAVWVTSSTMRHYRQKIWEPIGVVPEDFFTILPRLTSLFVKSVAES